MAYKIKCKFTQMVYRGVGSTVTQLLEHSSDDPKIKGLNPVATGTGRKFLKDTKVYSGKEHYSTGP
jgi:hypothetical protein